jgi:cell division protein FtsI (penicillin-binding protein 3)
LEARTLVNNSSPDPGNRRFALFTLITSVFILMLIWNFFNVMILTPSGGGSGAVLLPTTERGPILDRNGNILAVQTRLHAVTAWMPHVSDPVKSAGILSEILDLDSEELLARMRARAGFLYIKRKASSREGEEIRTLITSGELPGISLEPEYGRTYPEGTLAGHVIGFVGTDNIGLDGIELTYDNVLSPPVASEESTIVYGNQLFLTLDLNVQFFAETLAREAWEQHSPDSVMIMVMDAKNGDFLAWSSWPGFNPNNFAAAGASAKLNRPVVTAYEPGSVFKVFSIASFMDLGGITPASTFYCDGQYEMTFPGSGEKIIINCLGTHGAVRPQEILKFSCNSGTAYASETVSRQEFYDKLVEFGFGSATHLPFPGETAGILRRPNSWSGRTKPTIAIGQELSVSAVQVMAAATALANDGMVLEPHIVKKIAAPDGGTLEQFDRRPIRQALQPEVAEAVLLMMETATESGGTAWRAAVEGTRISIKTGTGEIYDPATRSYSPGMVLASALALFPTDDPRFIIYVVIDKPRGEDFYGGRIAAPMVKQMTEELNRYYGIPGPADRRVVHDGVIRVQRSNDAQLADVMPDLSGYSKRQLMPLLEQDTISVSISGNGWVVRQTPLPGTPLTVETKIILELE